MLRATAQAAPGTTGGQFTSFAAATRSVSTATTATTSDYTIRADATAAAFSVTLPASPVLGQVINVKKIDASANAVTVDGNGKNIDGTATKSIGTQYTTITVQYNGATWDVL